MKRFLLTFITTVALADSPADISVNFQGFESAKWELTPLPLGAKVKKGCTRFCRILVSNEDGSAEVCPDQVQACPKKGQASWGPDVVGFHVVCPAEKPVDAPKEKLSSWQPSNAGKLWIVPGEFLGIGSITGHKVNYRALIKVPGPRNEER